MRDRHADANCHRDRYGDRNGDGNGDWWRDSDCNGQSSDANSDRDGYSYCVADAVAKFHS